MENGPEHLLMNIALEQNVHISAVRYKLLLIHSENNIRKRKYFQKVCSKMANPEIESTITEYHWILISIEYAREQNCPTHILNITFDTIVRQPVYESCVEITHSMHMQSSKYRYSGIYPSTTDINLEAHKYHIVRHIV